MALDNRELICLILCDVSKDFDRVWLRGLLLKLESAISYEEVMLRKLKGRSRRMLSNLKDNLKKEQKSLSLLLYNLHFFF
jgi:hypothetical protein